MYKVHELKCEALRRMVEAAAIPIRTGRVPGLPSNCSGGCADSAVVTWRDPPVPECCNLVWQSFAVFPSVELMTYLAQHLPERLSCGGGASDFSAGVQGLGCMACCREFTLSGHFHRVKPHRRVPNTFQECLPALTQTPDWSQMGNIFQHCNWSNHDTGRCPWACSLSIGVIPAARV